MFMMEDLLSGLRSSLLTEYFLTGPHNEFLGARGPSRLPETGLGSYGQDKEQFPTKTSSEWQGTDITDTFLTDALGAANDFHSQLC